jgi:S-(hydroxymethyl)glutathione dehydrogenase/alcohol dehydrogenase
MRALLFRPGRELLELEDIELDDPRDDEVLVRVVASGLCHSELQFMRSRNQPVSSGFYGVSADSRMQPGLARRQAEEGTAEAIIMGHEPAGVVEAVGAKVTSVEVGDRVVGCGMASCGTCRECTVGRPHLCLTLPRRSLDDKPRVTHAGERLTQFASLGAFADHMLVHETSVVKVGDDIPFAPAAVLGCSIATGMGAVLNTASVQAGSSVAVFGAGGIGLSVVQGSRIAGATTIVAVDVVPSKLEFAASLGATHGVNGLDVDPVAAILELTGGRGADYSFYTTPVPSVAEQALNCLGLRGCLTCIAGTPTETRSIIATERRILGCRFGSTRPSVDIPRYLDMYRSGQLKLDEMVSHQLPPSQFEEAVKVLEGGAAARVVFDFDGAESRS